MSSKDIPVIPEDIASMWTAPFPEGKNVEYKESIRLPIWKVYQTLCAMLNEGGGHMIFGIRDEDLKILGLNVHDKEIDLFILQIDNIIHQGHIITISGNRLTTVNLNIRVVPLGNRRRKIIIVTVTPSLFTSYMLRNGSIFNRLNASNRFSTKLDMRKVDVQSQRTYQLIENIQSQYIKQIARIREEHQSLITLYKGMIQKLSEEKTQAESKLVIYQRDKPMSSWELFRRWVWSLFGYY
jgi:predicted HTH transcriptional regulator